MVTIAWKGLKDVDAALGELSKTTARNTLYRVLFAAAKPIDTAWRAKAPVLTGGLKRSGGVQKATDAVGNKAYSAELRAGGDQASALAAKRSALRNREGSFAEVVVGPGRHPKAIVQEFGSQDQNPQPYMRPAWDEQQDAAFGIIVTQVGAEVAKTAARARARGMRKSSS